MVSRQFALMSEWRHCRLDRHKIALAMKIGSHYRWWDIRTRDWLTLAKELGLSADLAILSRKTFANALPELAIQVAQDMEKNGVGLTPAAYAKQLQ